MLRNIFIQLWNRKHSNITLAIELLCVFCLVWYMADYLFVYAYNRNIPSARNIDRTWKIGVGLLEEDDADYKAADGTGVALYDDLHRVLNRIREYPGIEEIGVCSDMSEPESGSYMGSSLEVADTTKESGMLQVFYILPSEDFFGAFGYNVHNADFDWESAPRTIVISRNVADNMFPGENAVGQTVYYGPHDEEHSYKVVGVVDDVKRFRYLRPSACIYFPVQRMIRRDSTMTSANIKELVIAVRVKAGIEESSFREDFKKQMSERLRIGNYYLQNVSSYKNISERQAEGAGITNNIRIRIFLITFFLVNMLLCVMGAFWYRIRLRRGEIGLRKAVGASGAAIRNSLLIEGICILAIVAVVAMIIEANIVGAGIIETLGKSEVHINAVYLPDRTALRFLITNGITFILLSAVISIAVWLPARKAAAIPAVDALYEL